MSTSILSARDLIVAFSCLVAAHNRWSRELRHLSDISSAYLLSFMPLGDKGTCKATTVPATFFQEAPCYSSRRNRAAVGSLLKHTDLVYLPPGVVGKCHEEPKSVKVAYKA